MSVSLQAVTSALSWCHRLSKLVGNFRQHVFPVEEDENVVTEDSEEIAEIAAVIFVGIRIASQLQEGPLTEPGE